MSHLWLIRSLPTLHISDITYLFNLHITFPRITYFTYRSDLPTDSQPLRPADKSIISLAAAAAVILASKIHEIRPLRTVSTFLLIVRKNSSKLKLFQVQ